MGYNTVSAQKTFYSASIDPIVEDIPPELFASVLLSKGWWHDLLMSMLTASCSDMNNLESALDKESSWEDLTLLMEAADHHRFLQYAYDERQRA